MASTQKHSSDFSIESLLRKHESPVNNPHVGKINEEDKNTEDVNFSWLQCTRFKPPKLPRSRKRANTAKRNGRGPRIPFSPYQISVLERTFKNSQYLSSDSIQKLAQGLNLSEIRVKIWFQNRRARYRREKESKTPCELLDPTSHELPQNKTYTIMDQSYLVTPTDNTNSNKTLDKKIYGNPILNNNNNNTLTKYSCDNNSTNCAEICSQYYYPNPLMFNPFNMTGVCSTTFHNFTNSSLSDSRPKNMNSVTPTMAYYYVNNIFGSDNRKKLVNYSD